MRKGFWSWPIPLILVSLYGCDIATHQPRYQLHPASDGRFYRLDVKSGEVALVSPDGLSVLGDQTPKLVAGQYFQLEDGKFLKYLGDGKFEKSDFAIKRVK